MATFTLQHFWRHSQKNYYSFIQHPTQKKIWMILGADENNIGDAEDGTSEALLQNNGKFIAGTFILLLYERFIIIIIRNCISFYLCSIWKIYFLLD